MKRRIAFAFVVTIWMTGCLDPCGEERWGATPSPDGKYVAEIRMRDCGATEAQHYAVMLKRPGESEAVVFEAKRYSPRIMWVANDVLAVECYCDREMDKAPVTQVGSIKIVKRFTKDLAVHPHAKKT